MTNHRFVLDREDYVVDTSNSNSKVPIYVAYDTSEKSLRESVLIRRVNEFVDKLLVNNNPIKHIPFGPSYQPENPENFALTHMIYHAVKASHLNARDVAMSLKYKFDGKLHRDDIEAFSEYTARFITALEEHPTIFHSFTRTEESKNDRVLQFVPPREVGRG